MAAEAHLCYQSIQVYLLELDEKSLASLSIPAVTAAAAVVVVVAAAADVDVACVMMNEKQQVRMNLNRKLNDQKQVDHLTHQWVHLSLERT